MPSVEPRPSRRSAALVGASVGVAVGLGVFFLVATPIYLVRAIDLAGDARTFVRNGILRGAIPAGAVAAVIAGVWATQWRRRGGRLAEPVRRDSPGVTDPNGR